MRDWSHRIQTPAAALVLAFTVGIGALLIPACTDTPHGEQEAPAARAPVILSAEVDKADATTGDVIRYTVTLDHDPSIKVDMPEVFSRIEGFKVTDIKDEGPINRDGRLVQKKIFELRAFEVGSYILPALEVKYQDSKNETRTAGAPQLFVEIKTVLQQGQEQEDIADIKPVQEPPVDRRRIAMLTGGVLAVLVLLGGVAYYVRRRRRAIAPQAPPRPAWEIALQELTELETRDLLANGDGRTYCYALSEIFRRYLERRYDFPALEETTEEILGSFRRRPVPTGRPQDLARRVLVGTDWAKYAKQIPSPSEAGDLLQAARAFIEATVPPPPAIGGNAAGKETS